MKLATFRTMAGAQAQAGLVQGERIVAFGGPDGVKRALAGGVLPAERLGEFALSDVSLLAPIPDPRTIYGIGLNYADHVAEIGGTTPEAPIVFTKVSGSVTAPGGPVRSPAVVRRLDYEGELAIVIGAGGRIGGYCVADDVSARDLQRREPQWVRAKGADTFCPFGPWITTADEVENPGSLSIRTWVNGELRQDSSTSNLIFGCEELVEFISQTCTLAPGDLILTGTPGGVGQGMTPPRWLAPGDIVRIEIERLGAIEHPIA